MVDYRIETFLTLYETLNYHRTGEILQLSQPAVSRQIHTLEQEYGCRLFLYDGRRLTRTAAADRVAQYARSAVYNEKKMREELAAPTARTVRIGATKTRGKRRDHFRLFGGGREERGNCLLPSGLPARAA